MKDKLGSNKHFTLRPVVVRVAGGEGEPSPSPAQHFKIKIKNTSLISSSHVKILSKNPSSPARLHKTASLLFPFSTSKGRLSLCSPPICWPCCTSLLPGSPILPWTFRLPGFLCMPGYSAGCTSLGLRNVCRIKGQKSLSSHKI